jgi:hypothetical protein
MMMQVKCYICKRMLWVRATPYDKPEDFEGGSCGCCVKLKLVGGHGSVRIGKYGEPEFYRV